MARVRKPYWLPYSFVNWGICNLFIAGISENCSWPEEFAWASNFPLTKTLLVAHAALAILYVLGRVAVVGMDGAPRWRQARLPEPGEPPPGNRLAWPTEGDAAPRVATPAARALTKKRRPSPRDLGEGPVGLVLAPLLGFMAAVLSCVGIGTAGLVFNMPWANGVIVKIWLTWGVLIWACISASLVLKTRRLNEDA